MNVIYSSDENYVQHMAVSMLSLFQTNSRLPQLNVYIISNGISEQSRARLEELANQYHRTIYWIEFGPFRDSLVLDMEWPIAISAYARLFLTKMLPEDCDRILYLDCDTVVCDFLQELWETDMDGKLVGAVMDVVSPAFKKKISLEEDDIYINSGVLLIDLRRWRETAATERFLAYIDQCEGRVPHHDQGTINHVLKGQIYVLSPKFNAMTPHFTSRYPNLIRFYDLRTYYSKADLRKAVKTPAIIHYTPEFVGRVWEKKCKHPRAKIYKRLLLQTPWSDGLQEGKALPIKLRIAYWMQKNLPVKIIDLLFGDKEYDK